MKLRHKLNIGIIFAATLPALLIAALHSVTYLRNAETAYDANVSAFAQGAAKNLDELMQNIGRDTQSIAISITPQKGGGPMLSQQLAAYTYVYPYFSEILWVDPRGTVLASSDSAHLGQALPRLYPELADDLANVMQAPAGVLYVSDFDDTAPAARADIASGRAKQEALRMQLLLRVDAENGGPLGVLVTVVNSRAVVSALNELQRRMPEGAPVLLLNRRGEILLSSDPATAPFKPHPLAGLIAQKLNSAAGRSVQFEAELDGRELDFTAAETTGIGLTHAASWHLLTVHSDEVFLATVKRTLYQTMALLAAIIVAGALLGIALARSIVRPLEALSAAATRIGAGDLTARAPPASNDEIGDMGRTFNAMAEMVERERGELEQKVIARTAALKQAKREVEQASRGKDEFLAAISHELKTPLNHILGFSELLKEGLAGELSARQKDIVRDIFDAGSKQLSIVNALIELARLQAGKVELQAEPQDPARLLDKIAAHHAARAREAGLTFTVEVAQGLGEMPLDRKVVARLLDLLLDNACKFTPPGGKISLAARRVPRAEVAAPVRGEAGEYLELAVADNGPGIAPESLPRLFQPFVQGDGSLARRHGGTGVGLTLVKLLAELHGGGYGVQSEPGTGAKFLIWLPCNSI